MPQSQQICLASQSPRRSALISTLGVDYFVRVADIDESVDADEQPDDYVVRLAKEKAAAVARTQPGQMIVLAADTCVSVDTQIFGKPVDANDAVRMLSALSGRTHDVFTGVCVRQHRRCEVALSRSRVSFKALTRDEIASYWKTGEPQDKAGAYAIQGLGASLVTSMQGSYSGVVGLPLYEVAQLLSGFGVSIL